MNELLPGLTVVIPVFNRESQIVTTLDSLSRQTRRPEKVVLVDNNSTDNSLQVIAEWARLKKSEGWNVDVISQPLPGAAAARKAGENVISTRYAYFFDSDDEMHPDIIEKIMRDFEEDSELMVDVWPVAINHADGRRTLKRIIPDHPLENHLIQGLLATHCWAADTEYLRHVGGWNPEIKKWDDWELGLRLLLGKGKIKVNHDVRAEITEQADSISGLSFLHGKGQWEKAIDKMEILAATAGESANNHILRLLAYRRAILAGHYKHEGDTEAFHNLLKTAISSPSLSRFQKLILRTACFVTSKGIPGAGAIFPFFL